ncbi:type II toxin-antitoxin system VapB family antitoxin [Nocardia sp. NPDC051832]
MIFDSEEIDRLARELAEETGEEIYDALITALRERLGRIRAVGPAQL